MSTSTTSMQPYSNLEEVNSLNIKLLSTIENAMEGIALLDENGCYVYVNKEHATMFGYESSHEMIGASWQTIYAEPEIATIQNEIFPLLAQQGFWRGELYGKKRDGMPICEAVSLTMLPGGGLACFCRDITDKNYKEQELLRLAIVAEKTNSIVMILDNKKKVTWINDSFEKILGTHTSNFTGRDPIELLKPHDENSGFFPKMMRTLDSSGLFSGELKVCGKDGVGIWLFIDITAIFSADNKKTTGYIAVMNDITLIKQAEILLRKSIEKERMLNRLKTQFISLASHQFRTPLATLRSSIDVLDLKLNTEDHGTFIPLFQWYKHIMTKEIELMTELMENVLDIGRIEEKKIQLSKSRGSLQKFMNEFAESSLEPGPDGRSLVYRYNAPKDAVINMDFVLIRNALRNIVSNAYKYSLGQRAPELTVSLQKNKYHITVKDYGIGIPEMEQPLLYQSFFRANNAKHLPGCGLGLMIAKSLVEAHRGEINMQSQGGAGCLVTIILPR
jgi:PAS domain S-box-containing protein